MSHFLIMLIFHFRKQTKILESEKVYPFNLIGDGVDQEIAK